MLSSAGKTRHASMPPEGRTRMQTQLFPTHPEPPKRPPILDRTSAEDRAAVIRALARVMVKAVRPERKETDDER
jgi:hypothetical protein